jgi:hypothetical protein
MKLSELVEEYKQLVEQGKSIEVIERYYEDDMMQVENNAIPVKGKQQLLELEKTNISRVHNFSILITSIIIDEQLKKVMGEMTVRFHSKKNGRKIMHEAFVQHWDNDKIQYQRFYYGAIENEE